MKKKTLDIPRIAVREHYNVSSSICGTINNAIASLLDIKAKVISTYGTIENEVLSLDTEGYYDDWQSARVTWSFDRAETDKEYKYRCKFQTASKNKMIS